jgi:DNA repair protein RadC
MSEADHSGHRERLRSRYAELGDEALADHEFLELLLTYCIPRRDTNLLAHGLLIQFGSLTGVFSAEVDQLTSVDGIGQSAAVFLRMQGDLVRRIQLEQLTDNRGRTRLNSPLLSAKFALAALGGRPYETVMAVCLNSRREVQSKKVLQVGSLTEAQVYPRIISELALLRRAHGILLIHNHPSGNPVPSTADREVTASVKQALAGIGAELTDHLITGKGAVYSFVADRIVDLSGRDPTTCTVEQWNAYVPPDTDSLKKVMETYDA